MVVIEELVELESGGALLSGRFHKITDNWGSSLVFALFYSGE